jgi:hypothetical protein
MTRKDRRSELSMRGPGPPTGSGFAGFTPTRPKPLINAPIKHTITKTWLGWHIGTTDGIFILEGGMFAWTLKGAHRKANRLTRRLQRDQTRQDNAIELTGPCSRSSRR